MEEDIMTEDEAYKDDEDTSSLELSDEKNNNNDEDLEAKIRDLENQVFELKDKYIRAVAESDNIRKRADKEKKDTIKFANKFLLISLLGFMDDFERALKSGEGNKDIENSDFYKGIILIHKAFKDFMNDHGVSEIEALDKDFDPNIHEALSMIELPDSNSEKVVEVCAKGYKLNDDLLRTAKVIIGKPSSGNNEENDN